MDTQTDRQTNKTTKHCNDDTLLRGGGYHNAKCIDRTRQTGGAS